MRYKTIACSTAVAAALALASPALAANCMEDLDKVMSEIQNNRDKAYDNFRSDNAAMRNLREAADVFAANEMDSRCRDVVNGMKELAEKEQEAYKKRYGDPKKVAEYNVTESARLQNAVPVAAKSAEQVGVDTLLRANVRNAQNDKLGEVDDVVFDGARVRYVVVSFGGMLGMGRDHRAVPWNAFAITADQKTLVLNTTREELKAAPKVEKKDGMWRPIVDNDAYYSKFMPKVTQ